MRDYRRSAHTIHVVHSHFVVCTKDRKLALRGDLGLEVRKQLQQHCRRRDIEILQGSVRADDVHLLLSTPPHWSPRRVMQAVKGKTSHRELKGQPAVEEDVLGA